MIVPVLQIFIVVLAAVFFLFGKISAGASVRLRHRTPAHLAYVMKGHVQYRDLVALLPYWARLGVIDIVYTETGAPICVRRAEAPERVPPEECALLDSLFCPSGTLSPYYVDAGMKALLSAAKSVIEEDFRADGYSAFTKASLRSRTIAGVLGFVSVAASFFDIALAFQKEAFEIWGYILMAVGVACLAVFPMHQLAKQMSKRRRQGGAALLGPAAGMCLLFAAGIGIALFAQAYLPEKAASAWLMAINYIALSLFYLLALKRTDAARQTVEETGTEDPLRSEVSKLAVNAQESQRLLEVLEVVQNAWNEAEKVRVTEHPHPNY